ncbi:hypothetical protein RNI52_04760 [Labrys neptuniae]|uniref:hypothetical protein n=1 Tax=Labrys neptuniae TaxID=376174 RepID=UPI002891AAA2|nr:hypothetical protein [Labrys neptuniae]MDT3376632.1 hypothetical protein [Labrys neptuniae]
MTPGKIHIHEDDWGMRSLHPLMALAHYRTDLDKAAQHAVHHAAPGGTGWTDVHVIANAPEEQAQFATLTPEAFGAALAFLPRVMQFNATASAGFEKHDEWGYYNSEALCFGHDADFYLICTHDAGVIREIFFELSSPDEVRLGFFREALSRLNAIEPLCLVDYWTDTVLDAADEEALDAYCRLLSE